MFASSSRSSSPSSPRRWQRAAASIALAACSASLLAQPVSADNITSLTGTWSSGQGSVFTGPDFAQPTNFTFTYPNTTGISFSFTDDGYFEEAQYRFNANGTEPHCVQAIVIWQHGNYTMWPNQSITLEPIASDGRIQVQDPCAEETNVITYYDEPAFYSGFSITNDINHNRYMLQLVKFDGSFMPRMYLFYRPPTMLPTQQLWTTEAYKEYQVAHGGGALASMSFSHTTLVSAVLGAAGMLFWVTMA